MQKNTNTHGQRVESVAQQLASEIIEGEIAPKERLVESKLAKRFGMSRGPLREALRLLEERGLVISVPNSGTQVASFSFSELIELFQVREAMEGMACRLAARNMTDRDIKQLRQIVDQHEIEIKKHPEGAYLQEPHDLDFHFRIVTSSKNQYLVRLLCNELYQIMRICRRQHSWIPGRGSAALNEHRRIIEALEDHDEHLAEYLMRKHIRNARIALETIHPLRDKKTTDIKEES